MKNSGCWKRERMGMLVHREQSDGWNDGQLGQWQQVRSTGIADDQHSHRTRPPSWPRNSDDRENTRIGHSVVHILAQSSQFHSLWIEVTIFMPLQEDPNS